MKKLAFVLSMLVCTTGFALEVAGNLLINLDAETLSAGAFTTWANAGTAGAILHLSEYIRINPNDPTAPRILEQLRK